MHSGVAGGHRVPFVMLKRGRVAVMQLEPGDASVCQEALVHNGLEE